MKKIIDFFKQYMFETISLSIVAILFFSLNLIYQGIGDLDNKIQTQLEIKKQLTLQDVTVMPVHPENGSIYLMNRQDSTITLFILSDDLVTAIYTQKANYEEMNYKRNKK